jgi:hypothetical protein
MMLELESLATVGAFEATEDGGLIVGDQVAQWTGVSGRLGGGEVV